MKDYPDDDQLLLNKVFADIQAHICRTCGVNSHSLKSVRSRSIKMSILLAARWLAFKYVCQGAQHFPKDLRDKRAEQLYEKLLLYVKALYCKCAAVSPEHGGVVCGREYLDHDINKHRPLSSQDEEEKSILSWMFSFFRSEPSWAGEFELSAEDNAHLNQELKEEMKKHTHATANLWKMTEQESRENRFDQFRKQGIDLLVQYARSVYKDLGMHVPPKEAKRVNPQLQERPAYPFCVACCQQVEGQKQGGPCSTDCSPTPGQVEVESNEQSFVLCTVCHVDYLAELAPHIQDKTFSGRQVYAIGQDNLIYQQFMERLGPRSWLLHPASSKSTSVSTVASRYMAVAVSSRTLFAVTVDHELHRLALQSSHDSVWAKVRFPDKAKAVATLESDGLAKLFVVSVNGYLYIKDLQDMDAAAEWDCLTPSRASYLRCITFASGMAYALFSKRCIHKIPISDLLSVEFRQSPHKYWTLHASCPSEKLRAIAADSAHFYALQGDRRICRISHTALENSCDFVQRWQAVAPDLSNFVSVAISQEGMAAAPAPQALEILAGQDEENEEEEEEEEAASGDEPECVHGSNCLSQSLLDLASARMSEVGESEAFEPTEPSEPDVDMPSEPQHSLLQSLTGAAMDSFDRKLSGLKGLVRLGPPDSESLAPAPPQDPEVPEAHEGHVQAQPQADGGQGGLKWHHVSLCTATGALIPPLFVLALYFCLSSTDPALTALPLLAATSARHIIFHHKIVCLMGWVLQALAMFKPDFLAVILAVPFIVVIALSRVHRDPLRLREAVRLYDKVEKLMRHLQIVPGNLIAFVRGTALFASFLYCFQHQGPAIAWTVLGFVLSCLAVSQCISTWLYLELTSLQVVLNALLMCMHSLFLTGVEAEQRQEHLSAIIIMLQFVALLLRASLYMDKQKFSSEQTCWVVLAQVLFWMSAAYLNKKHIKAACKEIAAEVEEPRAPQAQPQAEVWVAPPPGPAMPAMAEQAMHGQVPAEVVGMGQLRRRLRSIVPWSPFIHVIAPKGALLCCWPHQSL